MSEIDGTEKFAKIRLARAIDLARDAIREAEAEGQPRTTVFLRGARAAATIVDDNTAGVIAGKLLGMIDDDDMPTEAQ